MCEHGVGHPSKELTPPSIWKKWMEVHGCDGCCVKFDEEKKAGVAELADALDLKSG